MTINITDAILNDPVVRVGIAKEDHEHFFSIYFNHYMKYKPAPFHKDMFRITQSTDSDPVVIMAFRGSSKSTIMTTSYPIWAILGKPKKKFIVILGQTQRQARQHLANIRKELETNQILKEDLGPFKEVEEEWGAYSLVIKDFDARITAVSMDQAIRGIRHKQYRPDLIIADDIEDISNVKSKESRDKIHEWIAGEVVPAGDRDTKLILVGNLLHEDSVLCRYKDLIDNKVIKGTSLIVPLVDDDDNITWTGKYPTMKDIDEERTRLGNEVSWHREFLLRIIPDDGKIIHPDWITKYKTPPPESNDHDFRSKQIGIDLAIAIHDRADFTSMVSASLYGYDPDYKIYILPNPVNKRLTMSEIIENAKFLSDSMKVSNIPAKLFIEDVAFQKSIIQELTRLGYPTEGINVNFGDKRARLAAVSYLIQNGRVVFPEKGAEDLINQLINFGVEKHDDLVDAFVVLMLGILGMKHKNVEIGMFVGSYYSNPADNPDMTRAQKIEYYKELHEMKENGWLDAIMGI